jgi:hypothetical protein
MLRVRIVFSALAGFALLCLAQCGLEQPYQPWDAPTNISSTGSTFSFATGADNVTTSTRLFLGYEVYYKIAASVSSLNSDDLNLTDPSQLSTHGFARMYLDTDTWGGPQANTANPPLLQPPTPAGGEQITLNFSNFNSTNLLPNFKVEAIASSSTSGFIPTVNLRRAVHSQSSSTNEQYHFKRWNAFWNGDSDVVPTPNNTQDGQPLFSGVTGIMVIYVYAYGRSLSDNNFLHEIDSALTSGAYYITVNFYCYNDQNL